MEGMLKTWKEPVPGSMDKRPVFQSEVVRPIENALIKAKTAALQHQRLPHGGYKNTPTPPQANGQFVPPPGQYPQNQYQRQQHTPQPGNLQPPFQPTPSQHGAYPYGQPPQQQQSQSPTDPESIKRDLTGIIAQTQKDFASDPSNGKTQQKLKALLDLQQVLNMQQLPPQSLQAIAAQIAQLSVRATPQPSVTPPLVSTPQWQPPAPAPLPPSFPFQPPAPFSQPSSAPPPFLQQPPPPVPAFNPQQLGSLAALLQNTQKPTTPQIREAAPSLEKAPHSQLHNIQNQAATPQSGNDLLAALTKAGLMKPPSVAPAAPTPAAPAPPAIPPPSDLAALLSSFSKPNSSQPTAGSVVPAPTAITASGKPSIPTTNAALKSFRPELLRALYADQPNQCSTCGRRFLSTPEGRANKARHLDWHFRINQRLVESSRAAHHRHWFPDAREWMRMEDFDASTASAGDAAAADGSAGANSSGANKPKGPEDMWIRAPAGVTRLQCPICYEEMRSSHPEELQDWVFMNAVYNNGRACHATCLQEMTGSVPGLNQQNQQNQQKPAPAPAPVQQSSLAAALASLGQGAAGMREGTRTPDSSLGKRKAEGDVMGSAGKMRRS